MGIFYLDIEYTNGNYYLGDIFEIALLSDASGYTFHSYINIPIKSIPYYVRQLCNVNDNMIQSSQSFIHVIQSMFTFMENEEKNNKDNEKTIIIAHGGYLTDFPILFINCMKIGFDCEKLMNTYFIDSVQILQDKGFQNPGQGTFADTDSRVHSALTDVLLTQKVVKTYINYRDIISHMYTYQDILKYIQKKLPISISDLFQLSRECRTVENYAIKLSQYVHRKSALNSKQLHNIAHKYFYID